MTGKKNAYNMRLTIKEREESMATGKALDGKPYAGNPHVRSDEGEVAPATTPRRGSLLYKRFYIVALGAALGVVPLLRADVLRWQGGGSDEKWVVAENWFNETAGVPSARAPTHGDELLFTGTVSPEAIGTGAIEYHIRYRAITVDAQNLKSFNGRAFSLEEGGVFRLDRKQELNVYLGLDLGGRTGVFDVVFSQARLVFGDQNAANGTILKRGAGTLALGHCFKKGTDLDIVLCGGRVDVSHLLNRRGRRLCFDGAGTSLNLAFGAQDAPPTLTDVDLSETARAAGHEHRLTSGTAGCVLTLDGTPKNNPTVFSGALDGTLGLTWAPAAPGAKLVLKGGVSPTTGTLTAASGEVALVDGAHFVGLSRLQVDDGASLTLAEGCSVETAQLVVGGVPRAPGIHADAAWGGGVVIVRQPAPAARRTAVWVGGADAHLATDANWEGGAAPDLADGGTTVVLAPAAALAELVLPDNAYLDGIDVRLPAENGALVLKTAGGGALTLGAAGLVFTNDAHAAATTLRMPVLFAKGGGTQSRIDLGTAGRDVVFDGEVALTEAVCVDLDGAGRVHFKADVHGPRGALRTRAKTSYAVLHGVRWAGEMRIADVVQARDGSIFVAAPGTTNEVAGAVVSEAGYTQFAINDPETPGGGGQVVLAGGVSAPGRALCHCNCGLFNATVRDVPLNVTRIYHGRSRSHDLTFNVSSNVLGINSFVPANGERIHLTRPFAFWGGPRTPYNGKVLQAQLEILAGYTVSVDLGGFDQELTSVSVSPERGASLVVSSAAPAQLHLDGTWPTTMTAAAAAAIYTNRMVFAGAAGLTFKGADAAPWDAFSLVRTSTTTGCLEVAGGRLTMAAGGSWPHATTVKATGGTLAIAHGEAFGTEAAVVANGGTIDLAEGVVLRVGSLYVKGLGRLPAGEYGGPACAQRGVRKPVYTPGGSDAVFSGKGMLVAGTLGCFMIIR